MGTLLEHQLSMDGDPSDASVQMPRARIGHTSTAARCPDGREVVVVMGGVNEIADGESLYLDDFHLMYVESHTFELIKLYDPFDEIEDGSQTSQQSQSGSEGIDSPLGDASSDNHDHDHTPPAQPSSQSQQNGNVKTTEGRVPCARAFHTACLFQKKNRLIVFGGCNGTGRFNRVYSIDYMTGACEVMETYGDEPSTRYCHSSVIYEDGMYVFGGKCGGRNSNKRLDDMYRLDLNTGEWKVVVTSVLSDEAPCSRSAHTSVVYGHTMFLLGGRNGDGKCCDDFYEFNFVTSQWKKIIEGPGPWGRARHSCALHTEGHKMYIFGGWNGRKKLNDLIEFSFIDSNFTYLHDGNENDTRLPQRRECHSCCVASGNLLLFGGRSRGVFMGQVYARRLKPPSLVDLCNAWFTSPSLCDPSRADASDKAGESYHQATLTASSHINILHNIAGSLLPVSVLTKFCAYVSRKLPIVDKRYFWFTRVEGMIAQIEDRRFMQPPPQGSIHTRPQQMHPQGGYSLAVGTGLNGVGLTGMVKELDQESEKLVAALRTNAPPPPSVLFFSHPESHAISSIQQEETPQELKAGKPLNMHGGRGRGRRWGRNNHKHKGHPQISPISALEGEKGIGSLGNFPPLHPPNTTAPVQKWQSKPAKGHNPHKYGSGQQPQQPQTPQE